MIYFPEILWNSQNSDILRNVLHKARLEGDKMGAKKDLIKKCITFNAVKFHGAFISSELIFRLGITNENKAHSICMRTFQFAHMHT